MDDISNAVNQALEDVNQKIKELENRKRQAEQDIKTCDLELEKAKDVALKLAEVVKITKQPSDQRHDIKTSTHRSRTKVPNGTWTPLIQDELKQGPADFTNLLKNLAQKAGTTVDAARLAVLGRVQDGLLVRADNLIDLKNPETAHGS
jgi:hypothetical protein